MQYFCPACFAKVEAQVRVCPHCDHDIAAWEASKTYTARLIQALRHPIDEILLLNY